MGRGREHGEVVWDLAMLLLLPAGAPCHSGAGLGPPAPWAALGGTCLGAAQLPMQFYHLEDCDDENENNIELAVGRLGRNWGAGRLEPALSLESSWGSTVSAAHSCQLPMAAQLLLFASSPGFTSWP